MSVRIDTAAYEAIIGRYHLGGLIGVPPAASGIIIFAHASGNGRFSPRNNQVAAAMRRSGMATLLIDLLTGQEETSRANMFDVHLLASRLASATQWVREQPEIAQLPIGYFGASTGVGAALIAAAKDQHIAAIVSRSGRPDLALNALPLVRAPTLLLVGSLDGPAIDLNHQAFARLRCPKKIQVIAGAGHLFEEPGMLDQLVANAIGWFSTCFARHGQPMAAGRR
jgi:dienelactone hydrolase